MRQVKALAGLVLSALLLTAVPAGCAINGVSVSPAPSPSSAPGGDDVVRELAGLSRDTVLFTVDGVDVTAEEYLFWLSQTVDAMDQRAKYLGETGINWDEEMSGLSMADYCKNDAMQTSKLYAMIELRARREGCFFNDGNAAALQAEVDSMVEQMGGREQFLLRLARAGLSQEGFDHINQVSYSYENIRETLYGPDGKNAPTDGDMDTYIEENDLLSAKHILLLAVDMNSRDAETGGYARLPDEQVAQKRAQAEDLLAELRESGDPAGLFDGLMREHSEDSGLSANPDGYVFTAGGMVSEFETAVRTLEYGQISDIVESSYGFHIILRQDPDTEALRAQWISDRMSALLEEMVAGAQVVTTGAYDGLDPEDYYTKLLAHRTETDALLAAQDAAGSDPGASPPA